MLKIIYLVQVFSIGINDFLQFKRVLTAQTLSKMYEIMAKDYRMSIQMIAETVNDDKETFRTIVLKNLTERKTVRRWSQNF